MSESFKYDRVKFKKKGMQRDFIFKVKEKLNLKDSGLAHKLMISQRTIYEWKNERITMSHAALIKMAKSAKLPIPKDYKVIDWRIHLQRAGQIGGKNRVALYGSVTLDELHRKEKWKEWWKKIGQHKKPAPGFQSILKIKFPKKSVLLAEFVGIMLGDGGISQYHTTVTLSNTEKDYCIFVSKLIYTLFGIKPKIYKLKHAQAINIVANRKQLVDFCQKIGLVLGNKVKQQVSIPKWIRQNSKFTKACMRGLIDTDGCFYINSYSVNGKKYSYFKIAFTSASRPLVHSMFDGLRNLGIHARISRNQKDVRIENSEHVLKYIQDIGSHNHKHLHKIEQWKNTKNMLK